MPNIVPDSAAAWYYLRDPDYERLKQLRALSDRMARAATLMTDTTVTSRIRGGAWPAHFNRPVAEAMDRNVQQVGMPQWDPADLALARGLQRELCVTEVGLATQATPLGAPVPPPQNTGGPSDDIGDVSWVVPTAILGYPSNIPNATVHSWSAAVAMATPIAHKGATAGAKVLATTMLDLLMQPELVRQAKEYFAEQTRSTQYEPFVGPADMPIVTENQPEMERVRPAMRRLYYNPARYGTYLEQLGITYPTVRAATTPQRCN